MDIFSLSNVPSTRNITNDIQLAVLNKSLESYETTGENLTKLMEASVTPHLGQNIDFTI